MKKLSVDISDEIYKIFEDYANRHDITVNELFERYFCVNGKIDKFRIAKRDYFVIIIIKNIQEEIKNSRQFLLQSKDIKGKEVQYKFINSILSSIDALLDIIIGGIENADGLKYNESDEITIDKYIYVLNRIHELCTINKSNMVKFLNLLVDEFDEIKLIRLG